MIGNFPFCFFSPFGHLHVLDGLKRSGESIINCSFSLVAGLFVYPSAV